MRFRIFILVMIIAISTVGCDVHTDAQESVGPLEEIQNEDAVDEQTISVASPTPTSSTTVQPTPEAIDVPEPTEQPTVTQTQAAKSTQTPTADITPKPTSKLTAQPTPEPTPESTPEPTLEPTPEPTPEPEVEITAVSSSFINAAMAEINRRRQENGVEPAELIGSISSSCKAHAIEMAETGSPFHDSNPGGCEAVGRVSDAMPGSTVGSTAVTHVGQLATADVTKIGIGAVYCNGYLYFVVRGMP